MKHKQLHRHLPDGVYLPSYVGMNEQVIKKLASGLPIFYLPDGRFCYEATEYMQWLLFQNNPSIRLRGGSLRFYAFQLAELIRSMYYNNLSVLTITDSNFEMFIEGLSAVKPDGTKRSKKVIRSIGSRALDFLHYTTTEMGYPDYVSENGVVRGHKSETKSGSRSKSKRTNGFWHHHSYPVGGKKGPRTRFPIGDAVIQNLHSASDQNSHLLSARQKILLSVLEHTGGRRSEVCELRVPDIVRASIQDEVSPLVRLRTVKGDGSETFRFVPVPKTVIDDWVYYIESARLQVIDSTVGLNSDHEFLFVNLKTGLPLSANTITNELSDLKRSGGLKLPAHAHLFRHRFITLKLKQLIIEYGLRDDDSIRSVLASSSVLKAKLKEWSGHKLDSSLETYLDYAFQDAEFIDIVVNSAELGSELLAAHKAIAEMEADLKRKDITELEFYAKFAKQMGRTVDVFKQWVGYGKA